MEVDSQAIVPQAQGLMLEVLEQVLSELEIIRRSQAQAQAQAQALEV